MGHKIQPTAVCFKLVIRLGNGLPYKAPLPETKGGKHSHDAENNNDGFCSRKCCNLVSQCVCDFNKIWKENREGDRDRRVAVEFLEIGEQEKEMRTR